MAGLDGYEVDHFSDEAAIKGPTILLNLGVPLEEALRNERDDAGRGSASGYRTERYGEATPHNMPGMRRLDTGALVALRKAPTPPRLIDLSVTLPQMLPTALHFVAGGLASADPALDAAFDLRFRNMLAAAAPDKSAPLVFYCAGAASWHSVNASQRAVKAGYTNVMFYRGGILAWPAASLPTMVKLPVAVIR